MTTALYVLIVIIINIVVKIMRETLFMKHEAQTLAAGLVEFCLQGKVIRDS